MAFSGLVAFGAWLTRQFAKYGEWDANMLLPLGIQKLKGFQFTRGICPSRPSMSSAPWPRLGFAHRLPLCALVRRGRSQWSSGSTLACHARGFRIEPDLQTSFCVFHENHCDTQLWARAAHLMQCLGRLRDYKWVSTLWLSNNKWRWSIAACRRTHRSSLQLYEFAAAWRWLTFAQRTQSELSHMASCRTW